MPDTIDTSIYNTGSQAPLNPFAAVSSIAGSQNAMNSNRMFQQQFAARQGVADAMASSIGPDGSFDSNKFLATTKGDKRTTWMGPDLVQQVASIQGQQLANKSAAIQNQVGQSKIMSSYLADGLDQLNGIDPKSSGAADEAKQVAYKTINNIMTDPTLKDTTIGKQIVPIVANMPTDYDGIRKLMTSHFVRTSAMSGQIDQALQKIGMVDTGGGKVPLDMNVLRNPALARGQTAIPNTLPATNTSVNPNTGAANYLGGAFGAPGTQPTGTMASPSGAPAVPSVNAEALSPTTAAPGMPPLQSPPPSGAPGTVMAAQGPGQAAMTQQGGATAASRKTDAINQAVNAPQRLNVLENIIKLSENGVKTGNGQAYQNELLGLFANAPGVAAIADPIQKRNAEFQELQKFMETNTVMAQQALGGDSTDLSRMQTHMSNPNDAMFPSAIQAMARYGKAAVLAQKGRADAMQKAVGSTNDPAKQEQFEQDWRNNFDMNAYHIHTMAPGERKQFLQTLPAQQRQKMLQSRQWLRQNGALTQSNEE